MKKMEIAKDVIEKQEKDKQNKLSNSIKDYMDIKSQELDEKLKKLGTGKNPLNDVKQVGDIANAFSKLANAGLILYKSIDESDRNKLSKAKLEKLISNEDDLKKMQEVFDKIANNFEKAKKN
ncbi:hypothetical protein DCO58_09305 [Helicobacter saguini]|uniref:Uncharacterized protein n=1 Tax=Helicobacter saguini TaxID=1548018 RepID=A0A347VP71_9HELI|nr:hypothetical protein [Helicobacter saguini]MWV61486.1 hypothetical protein [Helicobacter saguini]MWV67843.1 hypothetical protein [Helicobacter saguini]MWV70689.1 hypothetical protein [Helicobacter saguini]MWV72593.1 hypothetical protein [Helicobacter saguini]TLD94595.1 hypothetical protein LS64_005405 [Helicobacter saguini]